MLSRLLLSAALVAAPIGVAAAQPVLAGTGQQVVGGIDQNWDVACRVLTVGSSASLCDPTGSLVPTFHDAARVTATPGGWHPVPTANGSYYIGRQADASLRPDVIDENEHFEYIFRTTFDLGTWNPFDTRLNVSLLRLDNYWLGYRLNGGALQSGGISPTPQQPTGGNWENNFQLTIDDGFQAGANTLEIVITGNGRTDGILAEGQFMVTPEPGTWALMATGLVAVAGAARRRRSA